MEELSGPKTGHLRWVCLTPGQQLSVSEASVPTVFKSWLATVPGDPGQSGTESVPQVEMVKSSWLLPSHPQGDLTPVEALGVCLWEYFPGSQT